MCIRTMCSPSCMRLRSAQRGHVHYLELDQFVGEHFLITVHGPLNPKVPWRPRYARPRRGGPTGERPAAIPPRHSA